jgi:mono/diheme cytochrome c family protein
MAMIRKTHGPALALASCITIAFGCAPPPKHADEPTEPSTTQATTQDPFGDQVEQLVHLEQGWSADQRKWFYTASQGSRLMPYAIFMALEQPDGEARFADPDHLRRFRWLTDYEGSEDNDGLPLGFVRSGDAIGLTCSACHTAQINYRGTGIRVDGGPAMADVEGFLHALTDTLAATLEHEDEFERLAAKVLGEGADEAAKQGLRAELQASYEARAAEDAVNRSDTAYGFARIDAFGRIFNRAMRMVDAQNGVPASAPVSFPVLWDTPAHDWVQWSAFASNAGTGAVQRNVGQLIGVFAELELELDDPRGYPSSVDVPALIQMEAEIAKLRSPSWPAEVLGPLDEAKLAAGEAIYTERCVGCHARIDPADPEREVVAQMIRLDVIGTDPTAAMNIVEHAGRSGALEGKKDGFASGETIGPQALSMQIVGNLIGGVLQYAAATQPDLAKQLAALQAGRELTPRQGQLLDDPNNPLAKLLAYKARPLNGVWSSAPYLHNGSVPTLHDLLSPPDQRPKTFWVGRLEFDPEQVGFVSEPFEGGFELDTTKTGNGNGGHLFGTNLDAEQRAALLEYLKSL